MFRSEEYLALLEQKASRIEARLSSGQWKGSRATGLVELDALNWACKMLRECLDSNV